MVLRSIRSLLSAMLAVAIVLQPVLAAPPMLGQLTVKGEAKINGIAARSGGAVFSGDRLSTEINTVAELALHGGSSVLLPAASIVVLNQGTNQIVVGLKQGSLAILSRGSSPTIVEANGARIRPATDAPVVLEVAINDNSLKVLARRGSAVVETAGKSLDIGEGKELDATLAPPDPGGAQAGTQAAGTSTLDKFAIITAVAAGLTGLALGIDAITRANPADCTVVSPSGAGSISCP